MREAYLVKRRSLEERALPSTSIVIGLLSFSNVSHFTPFDGLRASRACRGTFHEIR